MVVNFRCDRSFVLCSALFLYVLNPSVSGQGVPNGDTAVQDQPARAEASPNTNPASVRVSFDDRSVGVVFVEANGERIRIDTKTRTVERVTSIPDPGVPSPASASATAGDSSSGPKAEAKTEAGQDESPYDFDAGDEPYDHRLINVPTPKKVPKGTWNLTFTHRFTQPVHPISSSGKTLLGLDSFGIASFGVAYGITDKLWISAYRSPLCQKGLCRTIEVGIGYNLVEHDKDSRWAVMAYGSIEGNENFTEEYTYNLQSRVSFRAGKRVYLFFSPAVHLNANGQRRFNPRPTEFFPPATAAATFRLPTHGASFGLGASVLITPTILALFEVTPRTGFMLGTVVPIRGPGFSVTGFRNESEPEIGFGIQKNVGQHSFSLTFSNTQTTTTSRYNSSNLGFSPKKLVIGFNLSRRF